MSIIYKKSSSDSGTTLTSLKYGGTDIGKVIYKSSSSATGVTVFEKATASISETLTYTYKYTGSQSGATFYYPAATIALAHIPIKVTAIKGLLGEGTGSIASDGLSGSIKTLANSSNNYTSVMWSISGSNLVVQAGGSSGSTSGSTKIYITYTYYT